MMGGILTVPGCDIKIVGDVPVLWLPRSVDLSEDVLQNIVDADEWQYACTMRAVARRQEFLRSRWLIRTATAWRGALPRTERGGPGWPPGWRGSLSHKDGDVAVSLTQDPAVLSVGIDVEDLGRVKEAFASRLCNTAEFALLGAVAAASGRPKSHWLGVLFSFKEALFKCHHPLGGRMFYFHDAAVTAITGGTIAARVLLDTTPLTPAGTAVTGHFLFAENQRVLTAITQRPPRLPSASLSL